MTGPEIRYRYSARAAIFFIFSAAISVLVAQPVWMQEQQQQQEQPPQPDSSQQIMDRVVNAKVPVLLDFTAVWCMPCRMLAPTIDDLRERYKNKLLVIKVDIDRHRGIAAYFGISSIPVIFLIKERTVIDAIVALREPSFYDEAVKKAIAKKVTPPPEPAKDSAAARVSAPEKTRTGGAKKAPSRDSSASSPKSP